MNMKLKYYLRGLGVGILITTFILSFGNKKEKLTDNEIIARARELGMVMKDENNDSLQQIIGKSDHNNATKDETDATSNDSENDSEDDLDGFDNSSDEADSDGLINESADTDSSQDSQGETDSQEPEGTDEEVTGENQNDVTDTHSSSDMENKTEYVTFTITRGLSSRQVSEILYQKGLIDDVDEFNKYIIEQGKSKVIRIGTYTLPKDSDYEEILDIIT